jgi:hypothetical protein
MSSVDFHAALGKQLGFIRMSCASFDEGFHDEAIRIAQSVRVIVHDTKSQTSVLTHLGVRDTTLIVSTCLDIKSKLGDPKSPSFGARCITFNGMGTFAAGPQGMSYFPKLGGGMFSYELRAQDWWEQVVFILDESTWVSRKDVVLVAANKDGGAHVDPSLTPFYVRLMKSGDLGYFVDERGRQAPISGHHFVALRQIGYEVLASPSLVALAGRAAGGANIAP